MDRSQQDSELDQAIEFVCTRVEEQARRENQPLQESERLTLRHPPADYFTFHTGSDLGPVTPNPTIDRIVRLIVCAQEFDEASSSEMQLRWNLVAVLLKMARHPVSLILQAADIEPQLNIPWWDKWLLWTSALVLVAVTLPIAVLTDSTRAAVATFSALVAIVYFVIRRQEHCRLQSAAAKYRRALIQMHSKLERGRFLG